MWLASTVVICTNRAKPTPTSIKTIPFLKKQRRQLRNIYAIVRSMERKKMYVKDLKMKSRYLEWECRGLSRMLQCFIAENQALQIFFSSSP
ncbi:hypothetical protein V6Z11_A01G130300 [Gossypium hirsutum]